MGGGSAHCIVNSYDHTYHQSIKRTPASITEQNQLELWQQLYVEPYILRKKVVKKEKSKKKNRHPFRYKVGDTVHISHLRNVFTREYDQKWTGEVFTIVVKSHTPNDPLVVAPPYIPHMPSITFSRVSCIRHRHYVIMLGACRDPLAGLRPCFYDQLV